MYCWNSSLMITGTSTTLSRKRNARKSFFPAGREVRASQELRHAAVNLPDHPLFKEKLARATLPCLSQILSRRLLQHECTDGSSSGLGAPRRAGCWGCNEKARLRGFRPVPWDLLLASLRAIVNTTSWLINYRRQVFCVGLTITITCGRFCQNTMIMMARGEDD